MTNTVTLPWPPKALNPNARPHWREKHKAAKAYRAQCFYLCKQAKLSLNGGHDGESKLQVFIDFYPPTAARRDDDNLVSAFKSGRDGVADALGIDDRFFTIHPRLQDKVVAGGRIELKVL